jgi:hypothetical protein
MTHIPSAMNWRKVNEFVEVWAAERALPANLKDRTLTLVDFEREGDCEFFYPGRTLLAQRAFTSALAKFARARQARTEHVTINPEHYRHWLLAERADDSDENRGRYIESRYQVLPPG